VVMKSKRIVAVSGGKGGTGKSFIAVNLAVLLAKSYRVVLIDLDVEAPNDYILLNTELDGGVDAYTMIPYIDYSKCIKCGECSRVCGSGAIIASREGLPYLLPRLCSGCRACYFICPTKAIKEARRVIGRIYTSSIRLNSTNLTLVTGVLNEGEEHVPPLVIATKERGLSIDADLYVVDTSAGTSNTVASALLNTDIVIAVTEPTPLGYHDLGMILELTKKLDIETWIVMNKVGLGDYSRHVELASKYNARIVAWIDYSHEVLDSYIKGIPIVVLNPDAQASNEIRNITELIEREVL